MGESGNRAQRLRARIGASDRPLILDGALGTELERRGSASSLPLWSTHGLLHDPDLVREIHRDYVDAGAEILTANTFRTQRSVLARAGIAQPGEQARSLSRLALALAREAAEGAGREIFVAGSAPPLEDCYRPDRVPDDETLRREHAAHAQALADGGADLILIETINCIREALAALAAARGVGLPILLSFVPDDRGRLLSGEPLSEALAAVRPFDVLAAGVNCLPENAVPTSVRVLSRSGIARLLSPNLGAPLDAQNTRGERSASLSPVDFAERMLAWSERTELRVVGGCCGTTPQHIRALAELFSALAPKPESDR